MSAVRTPSEAAAELRAGRAGLIKDHRLTGAELRSALSDLYERSLADLLPAQQGIGLVAVGSLGRGEVAPYGDIDLVLVHDGQPDIGAVADSVWYPLWDAGVALDHSVRTVPEAVRLADADLAVALGLLVARPVAGDLGLGDELRGQARAAWRRGGRRRVAELVAAADERVRRFGELAFLVEPDLKQCLGGLRDVHALHGLAVAQLADPVGPDVAAAYRLLLDVRGELHLGAGRALDRLVHHQQAEIAAALGYADADALLRAVSDAGRTVAFTWDMAVRRIDAEQSGRRPRWRRRGEPTRRPLADGVVEQGGEVVLARDADPGGDPALVLRVAAAAATSGLPVSPFTLSRLVDSRPSLPVPWPAAARDALVGLLAAGHGAIAPLEALDRTGLLVTMLPEWEHVRCRPQRDPVHRFTVDRHLIETAAHAADRVRDVSRPDLLLLAALLHDIGKGRGDDHSRAGAAVAARVAERIGLPAADAALVAAAVRQHLLLPDTATRRDLDDPATVATVATAVDGSTELLEILAALAEADGLATGPAAWSDWKASLIMDLTARTRAALHGAPPAVSPRLTPDQQALAREGVVAVMVDGGEVTVAAPDSAGLLSRAAGVLALHHLDVRAATITTELSFVVDVFTVTPRFGRPPDPQSLRADLLQALAGRLPLRHRLDVLEKRYRSTQTRLPPPRVLWFDEAATDATVVELRAGNSVGLLHRVTAALESCGLDVRSARISTQGTAVVDAFYVVDAAGRVVSDPARRARVEAALVTAAGEGD